MSVIFEQTAVLVAFAFCGWLVCHLKKTKEEFSSLLSVLEFYVFCPAVTYQSFATNFHADVLAAKLPMLAATTIMTVVTMVIAKLVSRKLSDDSLERGVYAYSMTIPNYGYVGYPLALALLGSVGRMDFILFCLPMSVFVYTEGYRLLTGATKVSLKRMINPANIAMVLGMIAGLCNVPMPQLLDNILSSASACMGPISMLMLGMVLSAFSFKDMLAQKNSYLVVALRMIGVPLLTWAIGRAVGCPRGNPAADDAGGGSALRPEHHRIPQAGKRQLQARCGHGAAEQRSGAGFNPRAAEPAAVIAMKTPAPNGAEVKALTKSTLCQTLKNLARQGSKLAGKGAYMDVSDRRLQVRLTQQAKIPSNFSLFEGIFAFAGFVSGLTPAPNGAGVL